MEDFDNQLDPFWERKDINYKAVPLVEDLNTLVFCLDLLIELFLKFDLYFDYVHP